VDNTTATVARKLGRPEAHLSFAKGRYLYNGDRRPFGVTMPTPRGVSDHPARNQMEDIWRSGGRANDIVEWLEDQGLPVLKRTTIARYGQRYWTEKIKISTDVVQPDALGDMIQEIEQSGLGKVTKIGYSKKKYPGWDKVDGVSVSVEKESIAQTLEITPQNLPSYGKASIASIKIKIGKLDKDDKPKGFKKMLVVPDQQIGYHLDVDGNKTTTHDEAAINVTHQVAGYLDQRYGLDTIVNLGDALDLPGFSTHRSAPGFMGPAPTQLAIDRYGTEVAVQRELAPNADIIAFFGNHEDRLNKSIIDKLPNLYGISKANERNPVLSIANLCRFEEYGITAIDVYPDGIYWANDYLRFMHGNTVASALGGTAAKYLNGSQVSTVYGHIHRLEFLMAQTENNTGKRDIFAGSPGCLARIDGVLPSSATGIKPSGGQAGIKNEKWQHGLFIIDYEPEGLQRAFCSPLFINNGMTVLENKIFTSTVTPNGDPL
jgi:hypothetical protein